MNEEEKTYGKAAALLEFKKLSCTKARAWKDPAYKKKLMQNPREVFKEYGFHIPENLHITVLEEHPKELHIVT